MRVKIEIVDNPEQEEVIIRCTEVDAKVRRINEFVAGQEGAGAKITFYKEGQEFYFPVEEGVRKLLCNVQSHIFRWLEFHIDPVSKVNHQMV